MLVCPSLPCRPKPKPLLSPPPYPQSPVIVREPATRPAKLKKNVSKRTQTIHVWHVCIYLPITWVVLVDQCRHVFHSAARSLNSRSRIVHVSHIRCYQDLPSHKMVELLGPSPSSLVLVFTNRITSPRSTWDVAKKFSASIFSPVHMLFRSGMHMWATCPVGHTPGPLGK